MIALQQRLWAWCEDLCSWGADLCLSGAHYCNGRIVALKRMVRP